MSIERKGLLITIGTTLLLGAILWTSWTVAWLNKPHIRNTIVLYDTVYLTVPCPDEDNTPAVVYDIQYSGPAKVTYQSIAKSVTNWGVLQAVNAIRDTSKPLDKRKYPVSNGTDVYPPRFEPIIEHSKIPNTHPSSGTSRNDTVWDYHRDSIFNVEWYAEGENGGTVKIWRAGIIHEYISGVLYTYKVKITLAHTFKAPHVPQYYKHIKESQWVCIREQFTLDDQPMGISYDYTNQFLFYKQYSSYTIHTL
jgi:hypothetical protein